VIGLILDRNRQPRDIKYRNSQHTQIKYKDIKYRDIKYRNSQHTEIKSMPLSVGGKPGTLSRDLTVLPQGLW